MCVRWICLAAAVVAVPATWLSLVALRGPDPCFPGACSSFTGWFHVLALAPGLTGMQVVVLFVGLAAAAGLVAFAAAPDHRGLLATVLVAATIPLSLAVVNSSSAKGTWFGANGRPQDGAAGRSMVEVQTGCSEILVVDWPLGTAHTRFGPEHWFIRDPHHRVPADSLAGDLDLHATLPSDARDTGLRRGTWHLWLSRRNRDAFLESGDVVERWPFVVQQFGCA